MALAALTARADEELRPTFEKATRDPHPNVRLSAVGALSKLKNDGTVSRLAEILQQDSDEDVRAAALGGLALGGSARGLVLLLETAQRGPTSLTRTTAMATLLRRLGLRMHTQVELDGKVWRSMIEEMKHNSEVREAYQACGVPINHRPEDKMPDSPGHQN